jgi:nitronate monooxygenase
VRGPLPVLAAGSIADRRGVKASIDLGAVGVWVGTRFLAAQEANIHADYLERVLAASGEDTLYSRNSGAGKYSIEALLGIAPHSLSL